MYFIIIWSMKSVHGIDLFINITMLIRFYFNFTDKLQSCLYVILFYIYCRLVNIFLTIRQCKHCLNKCLSLFLSYYLAIIIYRCYAAFCRTVCNTIYIIFQYIIPFQTTNSLKIFLFRILLLYYKMSLLSYCKLLLLL